MRRFGLFFPASFSILVQSREINSQLPKSILVSQLGRLSLPCPKSQQMSINPCVCSTFIMGTETIKTAEWSYVSLYGCRSKCVCAGLHCALCVACGAVYVQNLFTEYSPFVLVVYLSRGGEGVMKRKLTVSH